MKYKKKKLHHPIRAWSTRYHLTFLSLRKGSQGIPRGIHTDNGGNRYELGKGASLTHTARRRLPKVLARTHTNRPLSLPKSLAYYSSS